jgi:hypothetical protein
MLPASYQLYHYLSFLNFANIKTLNFHQKIADSWPASIDDTEARKDWNWKHEFDIESMTVAMLEE